MYTFAKFLTEGPEKIEKLLVVFFKVLIILWLVEKIFDYNVNLSVFTFQIFLKDFDVVESIEFVLKAIVIWILVWNILIDILLGIFIISFTRYLSKKFGDKECLNFLIYVYRLGEVKNDQIIETNRSFLVFYNSFLKKEDSLVEGIHSSRVNEFFHAGIFIFLILLIDSNWPIWTFFIMGFLLFGVFIMVLFVGVMEIYSKEKHNKMNDYLYPLAKRQELKNAIEQIGVLSKSPDIIIQKKQISFGINYKNDEVLKKMCLFLMFINNKELGKRKIDLLNLFKNIDEGDPLSVKVYVSNLFDQEHTLRIDMNNTAFIKGESEQEFYLALEELLFFYRIKSNENSL